ncbi:MAG: hypothetical protein IJ491_09000 [Clostridia bacterium]|nr:hypothetical protein [Clostridia bacterium]
MRDWSRLLHSIAKLSYDEIVAEGKKKVSSVLSIIEKYSDSDSAPITLVGLAAYTATVDEDLSEIEIRLVKDIIGVGEKEFKDFISQVKKDKAIVSDLKQIANCMTADEMNDFSHLLSLIFAVDGKITDEELSFIKKLCA